MSDQDQENTNRQDVDENASSRRTRITWKQAFHLLKRVALRKFRLKSFYDQNRQRLTTDEVSVPKKEPTETSTGEKILYPSNNWKRPQEVKKDYVSIIYLNDMADLKPCSSRDDPNVYYSQYGGTWHDYTNNELDSDELARSILGGIIDEIKSRSSSSVSYQNALDENLKNAKNQKYGGEKFDPNRLKYVIAKHSDKKSNITDLNQSKSERAHDKISSLDTASTFGRKLPIIDEKTARDTGKSFQITGDGKFFPGESANFDKNKPFNKGHGLAENERDKSNILKPVKQLTDEEFAKQNANRKKDQDGGKIPPTPSTSRLENKYGADRNKDRKTGREKDEIGGKGYKSGDETKDRTTKIEHKSKSGQKDQNKELKSGDESDDPVSKLRQKAGLDSKDLKKGFKSGDESDDQVMKKEDKISRKDEKFKKGLKSDDEHDDKVSEKYQSVQALKGRKLEEDDQLNLKKDRKDVQQHGDSKVLKKGSKSEDESDDQISKKAHKISEDSNKDKKKELKTVKEQDEKYVKDKTAQKFDKKNALKIKDAKKGDQLSDRNMVDQSTIQKLLNEKRPDKKVDHKDQTGDSNKDKSNLYKKSLVPDNKGLKDVIRSKKNKVSEETKQPYRLPKDRTSKKENEPKDSKTKFEKKQRNRKGQLDKPTDDGSNQIVEIHEETGTDDDQLDQYGEDTSKIDVRIPTAEQANEQDLTSDDEDRDHYESNSNLVDNQNPDLTQMRDRFDSKELNKVSSELVDNVLKSVSQKRTVPDYSDSNDEAKIEPVKNEEVHKVTSESDLKETENLDTDHSEKQQVNELETQSNPDEVKQIAINEQGDLGETDENTDQMRGDLERIENMKDEVLDNELDDQTNVEDEQENVADENESDKIISDKTKNEVSNKKKKQLEDIIRKKMQPILFGGKFSPAQSDDESGEDEEKRKLDESKKRDQLELQQTDEVEKPLENASTEENEQEEKTSQQDEGDKLSEDNEKLTNVDFEPVRISFKPLLGTDSLSPSDEEEIPPEAQPEAEESKQEENVEGTQAEESKPADDTQIEQPPDAERSDKNQSDQTLEEESPIKFKIPKRLKGDEKPDMDPEFFYNYDDLVFKPVISEESNLPQNLLELFHSFGYDCKKRYNLNIIDSDVLLFSAGNLVVILNVKTREQKYLKTLSGGAVGAIAVHPSRKYFAVGEKGDKPNINVYEYPSLKLYRILRQGTQRGYAYLDFDPSGEMLASLGSSPDFMLTIWDWREEKTILRTKAFSQDVFKVTFSKDLKGILTSAGSGHIKFWKMAHTFTGFKLQGDIGKFGKTEISDIEGYAELPDGKVLSGSEWGNMLLWDGGLIQTEICRKKNKSCHVGSIQQITLNESDVYTIGEDGWVRVWDFETIDSSEPSEEGVKLEIEPINELKVGNNVSLRSMVKDIGEDSTIWYAQDSNGGIWRLDLSFSASSEPPRQLFNYHSGCINGIECCPTSHLFGTTADDGSVKIYNYLNFDILAQRKFNAPGTCFSWLSTNIDSEGGTMVAGFGDGVLRFLKLSPKSSNDIQFNVNLMEVFKPHTSAVRSIAIDSKNSIIATGSDDKTVFFFSNKKNARTPIGFVNLPSEVTYMTWTPAEYENRLLVCMKNGSVYEFNAPVEGKYDTNKSYLIEMNLKCRKYTFKSIKSRLRHEEEMEIKRKEEEERKKKEEEERRLRGVDEEEEKEKQKKKGKKQQDKKKSEEATNEEKVDDDNPNKNAEEEQQPAPAEDEWKPYIPEVPSKIHWAVYSSKDTFWLSMDDYDAGYLYECVFLDDSQKSKISPEKLDEPVRAVPVVRSDITLNEDIPLTCMTFNKNKTYWMIGEKNGVVRINPMPDTKRIEDVKHYWSFSFHDSDYGQITRLCLSYDEKYLFSVGADSNIFGILFSSTLEDLEKAKSEKLKITCEKPISEVADIDDPNAYSIEQAKQKSENDKMISIAENKKQEMRQKINDLRKMFKELMTKNDQLVPRLRLDKNEFLIEESIKQHVMEQVNEKINLTYRELAWQSEKCRLLLDKLQVRFKNVIDCDHIIVYTFDSSHFVSSFRTVSLPEDMENYKTELEKQYMAKLLEKQKNKENIENQEKKLMSKNKEVKFAPDTSDDANEPNFIEQIAELLSGSTVSTQNEDNLMQGMNTLDQMKKIFGKLRGNTAAKVERALKKMEEKKLKRLKRRKEWKQLFDERLPDDYENPEDVKNIKYAEENLGDFKLKSSDNYVVPEKLRMNVYKAVERLMQIKQFIHDNQMIFNKKLVSLRDKKLTFIDEINKSIDRLEQIQYLLGQSVSDNKLAKFQIRQEEVPEKKYEYTKDKLAEFKREIENKGISQKSHEDETSGFGGFSSGGASSVSSNTKKSEISSANEANKSNLDGLKPIWLHKETMSPLMVQMVHAKEIRLMFEQKQLYKSIEEKIALFDAELKVLRHDRARIAIFMKNADLRHVTIYEEFMLLRDFEKTENELETKLNTKKEENLDMQIKLSESQLKIDAKRKDIEKLDENHRKLAHDFTQLIHEETRYNDFLTKVYKRKIKRKKKTEGEEEDDESEEESDDEESDDEDFNAEGDDSDDETKEQLDLDICPSGLKQELFDHVCQFREKRLDLEENIAEEKRNLELLKKEQDALNKRAKIIESSLKQAQQELENFQKEKQKKINNLDIVVMLRLNQIQFLENGKLPADLSKALAFDSHDLDRLKNRIKELQNEKHTEKKLFKSLKERHQNLIRDKKKMDEYVGRLDELCNKMMTDKFGKLVDLEKLELIAVNQQIEELKQRLAENEFDHEKVMQDWLNKINVQKDESIDLIKANTNRINEMIDILSETKRIETKLDAKQSSLGEEMSGVSKNEVEERQRLHTLVQLQAQEIEALKAEISILSRKGGHILPPTQPPNMASMQS